MRRLFISLYLTVIASLLLFVLSVPLLIDRGLSGPLLGMASKYAELPRAIIETEFAQIPRVDWPAHAKQLEREFGYGFELQEIDPTTTSAVVLKRIQAGKVVVEPDQDTDVAHMPIRNSEFVAVVPFGQSDEEHGERSVIGFFYLLEKRLATLNRQERATYFAELNALDSVPIKEISVAEYPLTASERKRLLEGEIVSRDVDSEDETYLKLLPASKRAILIGPVSLPFLLANLSWIALCLLGAFAAAGVFFWLRPLAKDMRALDSGAAAFGQGNLDARVKVSGHAAVRDLARTFNAMAERTKALIGAQKELTDAVSHELRTPISRLRFGMFRLENSTSHDDWLEAMNGMQLDIDELDQLVDELLTYSRLKHAEVSLVRKHTNAEQWVAKLTSAFEEPVAVATRLDSGLSTLYIDERLMTRAVSNLLQNAVRFANSQVCLTIRRATDAIEIIVEDDGKGIEEIDAERIFEPFIRLRSERNSQSSGYGLGLAIVKQICDWHKGSIQVSKSSLGGARFTIRLRDNT